MAKGAPKGKSSSKSSAKRVEMMMDKKEMGKMKGKGKC